jgi:hypothetical protein
MSLRYCASRCRSSPSVHSCWRCTMNIRPLEQRNDANKRRTNEAYLEGAALARLVGYLVRSMRFFVKQNILLFYDIIL